jgi:hypothetical protein
VTFRQFPLNADNSEPPPSDYGSRCFPGARLGVWYSDQSGIGSMKFQVAGPTHYRVYDRDQNIVSSGTIAGSTSGVVTPPGGWPAGTNGTAFVPTAPVGGWKCGFYFGELLGDTADSTLYGPSRGSWNFAVIRRDARFPTIPAISGYDAFAFPYPEGGTGLSSGTPLAVGDGVDLITRGCLGLGQSRMIIQNRTTGVTDSSDGLPSLLTGMGVATTWWKNYADGVRPRELWMQFTGAPYSGFWDMYQPRTTANDPNNPWGNIQCKNGTIDGSKVFVETLGGAGTAGSDIIKVYYPNSTTLVETYDNLTSADAAVAAVNGVSNYIWISAAGAGRLYSGNTKTAIGNTVFNTVKTSVQQLYAAGVTHFEGPCNEPLYSGEYLARQYQLFKAAVKAGNPNALAMGPALVNISDTNRWAGFFQGLAVIGETLDVCSFHDYNNVLNGDINQGRNEIEAFLAVLATYGYADIELWQTEAFNAFAIVPQGIYHMRRGDRIAMSKVLLWEQYGCPAERNPYWYDMSHGFWPIPTFLEGGLQENFVNPAVVPLYVLAQETYGKAYHHRIDFGSVSANRIFLGNLYGDPRTGSVASVLTTSYLPGSSVTFTVIGTTSALTVVDGSGNESTVTPSGGRVTIPVGDLPTHLRLPAGAYVRVYSVATGSGDWGHAAPPSVSAGKIAANLGGVAIPNIADDTWLSVYTGDSNSTGVVFSGATLPDTVEVIYSQNITSPRLVLWCGPYWEVMPGIQHYTVETYDGSTWTQRNIIDPATGLSVASIARDPSTYVFGNYLSDGCLLRTFDPDRWIEVIDFATPQTAKGFRVKVTQASYGGEPDAQGMNYNGRQISEHGLATPKLAIQELSVISSTTIVLPGDYATEIAADAPAAWYRMDEASGTTMHDSSGNGLNGTFPGSNVFYSQPGVVGSAIKTVNSACSIPDNALLHFGDVFTFEIWMKSANAGITFRALVEYSSGGPAIGVDSSQKPYLFVNGGPLDGRIVATSGVALTLGVWSHIVVTKNGGTTKIWLNGIDVTVPGTNATFSGTGTISIGQNLQDTIDELALYPAALSSSRVVTHYQAGLKPSVPVLRTTPIIEGLAVAA